MKVCVRQTNSGGSQGGTALRRQSAELPNSSKHIFRQILFALQLVSDAARGCILLNLSGVRKKKMSKISNSECWESVYRKWLMGVQGLVIKKLAAASCLWSYHGACPIDHSNLLPSLCTFALCGTIYTVHPHQIIRWFTPCLHKTDSQWVIPLMCKWVLYNSLTLK